MVVSKRCKICAVIDSKNVSISGEHFGKRIPDLILKICGIEVDSRKASGALICQLCVIQLVHTGMFIEKMRNAVHRLKKNVREAKPKTPLKHSSEDLTKKTVDFNKTTTENGDHHYDETNECYAQSSVDNSVAQTKKTPKTPKKLRRESVNPDKIRADSILGNKSNGETNDVKFIKFLDDVAPAEKTPVKESKRKPTLTDEIKFSFDNLHPTPKKHKMESVSDSTINLSIEEKDGNETNIRNSEMESELKVRDCILCGKIFHSNGALRSHIETAHMGERLKACPHCSSEFRSKQKYESHVFSEKCKNTIHACQYLKCNKRFKTVHKMELHMQEKHSSQNNSE